MFWRAIHCCRRVFSGSTRNWARYESTDATRAFNVVAARCTEVWATATNVGPELPRGPWLAGRDGCVQPRLEFFKHLALELHDGGLELSGGGHCMP